MGVFFVIVVFLMVGNIGNLIIFFLFFFCELIEDIVWLILKFWRVRIVLWVSLNLIISLVISNKWFYYFWYNDFFLVLLWYLE